MTPVDPSTGAVQHVDPVHQIDPAALLGVPHGLAHLQHLQAPDLNGKFKPIDLESLSPKCAIFLAILPIFLTFVLTGLLFKLRDSQLTGKDLAA